ncbi:pyridoxamine 5'-phosphate oxidase family protein [Bradyrhizobium sp. HKCCYLS20291]|uniref:pyridoxamine 5'-phosphate oxidase family protein n=1 Tax=Bradyrhizobium sp. HKCCYLS20291 TaxID=3420766 RepID=UPI003EB97D74
MNDAPSADLAAIYPTPNERVIAKVRPALDGHSRKFIAMSPFCVVATSGKDGAVDASPRGGHPGFVHIDGDRRLLLPDRAGNNRLDTLTNITAGSGKVQLIFFVPGINETVRVGGTASLSTEPELLARLEEFGKPPRSLLVIDVQEVYFHCGKAIMRSRLWSQDAQVPRSAMASISEIIHDQTSLGTPEPQDITDAQWREQL